MLSPNLESTNNNSLVGITIRTISLFRFQAPDWAPPRCYCVVVNIARQSHRHSLSPGDWQWLQRMVGCFGAEQLTSHAALRVMSLTQSDVEGFPGFDIPSSDETF